MQSDRDVDPVHMEQDIFCGEMRGGLVKSLRSQLSELYIPLLRAQRSWGYCTSPHVTHFLAELEKYVTSLQDFTTSIKQDKQQILKRPVNTVSTDIMHRKSAAFDSDMISANEALVSDWMKTIEQILNEGSDDRVLDVNTSPLTELERWRRRQRTLESITEQLRGKECKTVIGFLISTKSRLLKKWKTIDISITDVSNETKSRVKYLEALQRHFDALSNESSPINLMGAVLPAIINGIKQMDSLSRSFSRNGYLGLLLTKVCNQLTMACRDFLEKSVVSEGSEDNLWDRIKEEMGRAGVIDLHSGLHHKNKGKENNPEQLLNTNTFYEKIQGCLALQAYFLEAVRGLREALGGSHGLHRFSSSSSLSTMQGKVTSFSTGRATKASIRVTSVTSSCDHSHDCQGPGVSLTDEETIMHNMDTLCCKLRQFANVILTLQQYKILSEQTKGLQKPSCEDLFINEPGDREGGFDPTEDTQRKEEHLVVDTLKRDIIPCEGEPYHSGMVQRPLQTLLEEDEVQSGTGLLLERHQLHSLKSTQQEGSSPSEQKVEVEEEEENEDVLTEEEKTMLRNLYNWEDPDEEGQCLSDVLSDCISNMFHTMASAVRIKLLLNVEKRDTERFEDAYSEFLVMNQQLERYLSIYLQALFLRKMNTAGALSVLNRFSVVFKEIRVIASSNTYTQAVKLYNRIAATLVGFENLWYQKWRSEVDGCVSGLNATLLVRNPTTQELMVNCDQRVIQLFEETKWMMQFKLNVPQAAILSLKQERKYKTYKSHLEGLLQEYQCVKKTIPKCLAVLFAAQLEGVSHHFQPGLSVLNWLSIDIEAFLHNVYTDITRLRIMVEKISKMKDTIIDKALADIQRLVLFNTDEVLSEPLDPPLAVTQRSTLVKTSHRRSHSRLWPTLSKSSQDAPISLSSPEYFRGQTCSAVLGCVCRSLLILAQVSGCDIERLIKGLPCHHKEDPPDPCSACVLFATVSENLSDPAFQKPLRLTLKLRLTIPTIVTDPPVESALHALMEAASAMLNVTDYLQWDHEQNVKEPLPKRLDEAIEYNNASHKQLLVEVKSLEELNISLCLLEDLLDMENKIDGMYLPIESVYQQLRSYNLRLPREEITEVTNLRSSWADLMALADSSFAVDVIQLRNSFDTQGPAAPNMSPEEAVNQLHIFQEKFQLYDAKRKTLNSLQRLFSITPKAFPELDRTEKDLLELGTLYELFQKFLSFNQRFRDTLWAEVDLKQNDEEAMDYWIQCQNTKDKLKDWDPYNEMAAQIQFYSDCFPVLHRLAAKEIRNRHWLQVMAVTGSSFPLEATVFRLHHLLDIELIKHQTDIISIATAAREELQLEIKMRSIEEEWSEQLLSFELHKSLGPVLLGKEETLLTLEQLEDARLLLAQMLMSRHIGPLREEAAAWADKLKDVAAILDLWVEVQDLWQNLQPVFSDTKISKELYQEAKRFAKVERNWIKLMRSAYRTKNVLQCCCNEEVPKEVILHRMHKELEVCCQFLTSFLDMKRQAFPRFYFLPDLVLLSFLSHSTDIALLHNLFGLIFSGVADVLWESSDAWEDSSGVSELSDAVLPAGATEALGSVSHRSAGTHLTDTDSLFPKSLRSAGLSLESPVPLSTREPAKEMQAMSVMSGDGECLVLDEQVHITTAMEEWLSDLQSSVHRSLESRLDKAILDTNQGVSIDEWTHRHPFQIARMNLLYGWTRDCEAAISDLKSDPKALLGAVKKHSGMISRLSSVITNGSWKHCDQRITPSQKLKLENLVMIRQKVGGAAVLGDHGAGKTQTLKITLNRDTGLFLTVHCKSGYAKLPEDVLVLFRTVSLSAPDHSMILRGNLTALGFKSPKMLTHQLQLVTQLVQEQLSETLHHHFSLSTLVSVVQRAAQKKEAERWRRREGRQDHTEGGVEGGRTSQSSSITSTLPVTTSAMSLSPSLKTDQSFDRKARTMSTSAARRDRVLVGETLHEYLSPRMKGDDLIVFDQIVKDIFGGQLDVSLSKGDAESEITLVNAISTAAKNISLVPHAPWVDKVKQLYHLSRIHHGIIVAGPPGAGKSSCISALIQALSLLPSDQTVQSEGTLGKEHKERLSHKLVKFNPQAVDDFTLLFGSHAPSHIWTDSIITSTWRKAIRHSGNTWLCFDGTLTPAWVDNFNSVLEANKMLQLNNGEHLPLTSSIRLLFETSSLELASPAFISRVGMLYLDNNITGWRPLAETWLAQRNELENHVLSRAFNNTLDPIFNFVLHDIKGPIPLTEVGLFQTTTSLLQAMLNDKAQSLGGPLHIERLFLFCLIWIAGGLIKGPEKKKFSDILKTHTSNLPDYDDEVSVFDFYVDESGEWDPWQSRMSQQSSDRPANGLGEVFVETIDTLAVRTLMDYADMASQNVLLVGSAGCGKTALVNDFFNTQDKPNVLMKRIIFSGSSKAKTLQQLLEQSIVHREGFIFGAKEGKTLQMFIDDVNLPENECCSELLRQVLDDKVLLKLTKPFERRQIEGLVVQATMSLSPHLKANAISQRLLRHFAVLYLPAPEGSRLRHIIFTTLQENMAKNDVQQLEKHLHSALVSTSCSLLESIKTTLRPSDVWGRQHYLFSLREMIRAFECLSILTDRQRKDADLVLSLWQHEIRHIVGDRLCRHADLNWFQQQLRNTIEQNFPNSHSKDLNHCYVTFPLDETVTRQFGDTPEKGVKVQLQQVKGLQEVKSCLQAYVHQYNKQLGSDALDIQLSENTVAHVVRVHRVLAYRHSGNLVVVGSPGSHLRTLLKLALSVSRIPVIPMDASQPAHFYSSLKSAVRLAASEGRTAAVVLTARELKDDSYLDAVNSILISGDYTPLFSPGETRDLLQVLNPTLQQNPTLTRDPVQYLASTVKANLHVIVCLPPNHSLLRTSSVKYPGFLSGCHMIWLCDWTPEAILHEAEHYTSECNVIGNLSEETRMQVASVMASIHHQILANCEQVPWAGYWGPALTLNTFTVQKTEKDGKETVKAESMTVSNLPYSAAIVKERIGVLLKKEHKLAYNKVFCGNATFKNYLQTFRHIYSLKFTEQEKMGSLLRKGLSTLDQSHSDVQNTQDLIKDLACQYGDAQSAASELLDRLSTRASSLERLKAQLGIGAKSLTVFLSQEEDESEETELEDLLKDDEFDRYDEAFFQMKERTCTSHSNKLKENLETAKRVMEEARDSLAHAKNQVMHWCNKVDKSCIERISRCQNPPFLLAQVMEMVIVMLNLMPRPNDPDLDTPRPAKPSGQNPERGQFQKSSGTYLATRPTKRGPNRGYGKGGKDKVDKSWWKALQNYVGDSTKFVDMIQNVACQDEGLAPDALERVEAYLGKTKGGTLGVTGEGSLLENAAPHATPRSITTARKFSLAETSGQRGGITIAAARYSSEEAATLVALVVALVEYTRLCGPLRSELRLVHELEKHKEEQERKDRETQKLVDAEEEDLKEAEPKKPELTAEDLPTLQSEVLQLQAEYDTAVMKKHRLEIDLQSHKERLKSAQDVLKRLRPLETQWKDTLELIDASGLITNCLIASAFLIYCGPFHSEGRHLASELFIQKCQEGGLSPPRKLLFRDMTLKDFLHNPRELKRFETKGPALNKNTAIVSCAFKYDGCNGTWVLLCDPMAQSIEWIKNHFIVSCKEVPYHELQSQLDSCLTEGVPLLLTYCDLQALAADQRFAAVLRSRLQFGRSGSPFKITVGDHQVECQPGFRLVLHTTGVPEEVPAEIAAFCTTLYFYQDQEGLSEQLLDSFVLLEKIRLGTEYSTLQKACLENMEDLQMVEEKILQCLSGECTLLQSLAINRSLSDLKKHYDEALAKKFKLAELEKSTLAAREGFRLIADRAALMFNLSNTMRQVNPVYHISFDQLLEVFSAAIVHSERYSIKTLVERITYNLFCYIGKYIMERDQMVYTLLLALEIESCLGHVTPGMIEFLICPDLCVAVMEAMQAKPSEARQHAKNPFEWMTEEQFKNVQILATYYSWFHNLFDRMYKDGKDMSWKSLCDSDQPENTAKAKGPEGLGGLGPLQRLLVIRAIRSDRLTQAASLYISSVLGKKYVTEIPSDLQACLQLTKPQTPILLLYSSEADEPRRQILELSARRGCETQVVSVNGGSISEERRIRYLIEESQAKGRWLLLENIHNSQPLMTSVECLLLANKSPDRHFRLWISAQVISNVPVQLLHASLRIITDTPKNMKDAMVRCMQQVCSDTLHSSGRPEWPALIHNLCYVHCAVRLRASSGGPTGWNCRDAMMFGIQDFRDALQVLTEEFRDRSAEAEGRSISWTGIRYLLSEVIYGKNIIDDCDKKSLASLFDLWISSTATKKDYDMTKLRYRIPAAFFDPDLQLNNLLQALDCIPRHALDVPEGVSMHSTPELHFGDEKYVYSWLQTLYDSFLFHQQQHSLAIQKHHRNFLIKSNKDQEVWEICYNILAKLPKGWSKDFINERLKKIGGNTLFNMFMRKELNHLMEVLSEVKRNLQAIRNSTECLLTLGDSLTVTELSVARDLSQQRVPSHWSSLAGMGSPPELWTAATWIRDLQQRTSHFEKILQLGQEKMPTYWLSAFKNPRGLLGVFRQQSVRKHAEQSSFTEPMEFHTMITQRDKDHIRDPPQEGMFVYGIHVWGVSWHKTEAELLDAPPRHGPVCLPVIHLQCLPRSEKASLTESMRSFDSYQCPVYSSFTGAREPVLHLDIHKDNIPASRWALRGMKATLQPF
ncbi:dynein axonemal heavy chain 8 [Amia ocellicauda]|uniref:dynein axonemal heavy chain 8 n=1 Tax=Amia ocellicauda TaxID=2972642 RepID=UPI0034648D6A